MNDNINSAFKAMIEQHNKTIEQIKIDQFNQQTRRDFQSLISQNNEQILLLREQNKNLKEQLSRAIENEQEAKKEAKFNRIWVYISCGIALTALIIDIIFQFIK